MIEITDLLRYPIKSTIGHKMLNAVVNAHGLEQDRKWAVVDSDGIVMTGRKYPALLDVSTSIENEQLHIFNKNKKVLSISIDSVVDRSIDLTLFSNKIKGSFVNQEAADWFSDFLGKSCSLVRQTKKDMRFMNEKVGARQGDTVSFADQCPLLLISEASLEDLNLKLEQPILMNRFRPNIIVKGTKAFEEDTWSRIRIGACEFDISQACERCVFTTIDPITKIKHPEHEPLRTLSTYRLHPKGGVTFGVHLIPRILGTIKQGDPIEVIN